MKAIIEGLNNGKYNVNLSEEQIKFAYWLVNNNLLYDVQVIDEMKWEEIK